MKRKVRHRKGAAKLSSSFSKHLVLLHCVTASGLRCISVRHHRIVATLGSWEVILHFFWRSGRPPRPRPRVAPRSRPRPRSRPPAGAALAAVAGFGLSAFLGCLKVWLAHAHRAAYGENLRDAVCERRRGLGGYRGSADEDLNPDGLVVNLHTLERASRLDSLVGLVEDDGSASQALAVGSVLDQNPSGLADVDNCVEVFLQGVLVVVVL